MDERAVEAKSDLEATRTAELADRVIQNLRRVIHAPAETLQFSFLCLLAEGHLIIEDFPGVGKTSLAKALARSIDCAFSRLQFTPDLLPSDVTGVNVFNQRSNEFEFKPGPVFANLLLVDEINRASPKTQAALLGRDRSPARRPARVGVGAARDEADAARADDRRRRPLRGRRPRRRPRARDRGARRARLGRRRRGDRPARRAADAALPPRPRAARELRPARAPARPVRVHGRARRARGSVRPRAGRGRARRRRGGPRLPAPRRARPCLHRDRRQLPRRPPAAAAPAERLRAAQRARVRARRVAAKGPLALDRAPRAADGEGPRGRPARRGRRAARRGSVGCRRNAAGVELRHAGAGGRLDPALARAPRCGGRSRPCCVSRQSAFRSRSSGAATTPPPVSVFPRRRELLVRRTVLLYILAAAVVAGNWLRLESPHRAGSGGQALWIALLALAPALVRPLWARVGAGVLAALLAVHSAFGLSVFDARPFDGRHDFFGPLLGRFRDGFLEFYDVRLPIDVATHPRMHAVILAAVFGFCLALGLAVATRRAVAAVLLLVVGAGWPATLLAGGSGLTRGAVVLGTALALFAGLAARGLDGLGRAAASTW